MPVPAAGLFGFELLLVPDIGWSPVMFDGAEDEGLVVPAALEGLAEVPPIAPELLAPVEVQ